MNEDNKKFIKEVSTLALPTGLQMMIESVVNLIDNIMIGSLGEACITAVSVSSTYSWLCTTVINALTSGATIMAAQDYGAKRLDSIKRMLSFVITWSVLIGTVFAIITFLFPLPILKIYSNVTSIYEPGVQYLRYIAFTIPLMGINVAITLLLRAVRNVKLGFYNSLFSCFANVFFNWVFIFGNLGMPAMGVAGAALGTLITRIIQVGISVFYLFFIDKNLKYKLSDYNPMIGNKVLVTFVRITIPILIMEVLANLVASAQTMITGRVSANYIAANSITHMAWQLPNVFCWGVGTAASIMIGNSLGSGDIQRAKEDGNRFLVAATCFGIFSAAMVQVVLPILLRFYNITEETKLLSRQMGYMASIAVFFIAFAAIICNGVIKSAGNTKLLLRIDLIGSWFIAIPLGYLAAFVFHLPTYLLYIILRSGNIIKSLWGIWYLKKGDWAKQL